MRGELSLSIVAPTSAATFTNSGNCGRPSEPTSSSPLKTELASLPSLHSCARSTAHYKLKVTILLYISLIIRPYHHQSVLSEMVVQGFKKP